MARIDAFWHCSTLLQLRRYDTKATVYEKRIKKAILGEGFSLISYFSTDKTLGTEYDIYLLCAFIADHVTLLAIFLLNFWAVGRMLLRRWIFCKKMALLFSIFGNSLVPELIIKG